MIGLEKGAASAAPSRSFTDMGFSPEVATLVCAPFFKIIFFARIYNIDCSDSNIAFDSRNKIGNHHLDSGSRRRILVSAAPTTSTVLGCLPPQSEI